MKKLALALCAVVLAVGLAACSGGSASSSASASASASEASTSASAASDSASASAASESASSSAATIVSSSAEAVDVSTIDYDVASMDPEEAFNFMHDFTNRTPDAHAEDFGKVLRIDGQVSRYVDKKDGQELVSYSIGVKGEGGTIWGVNFYVPGWEEGDYPAHKAHAVVTGVYGEVEGYGTNAGKTLICNPEDVVVE